jgi:PAS domain S-box-containing protein
MQVSQQADRLSFLAGTGRMARKMHAYDWANSPLGPPADWPQSLKTVIRIMLTSRYAMWMAWGPDLTFFCNDAYLPTVGIKRDWVLGSRSDKVWEEIWPDIGPRIDHVLKTGEATWDDSLLLFLERSGFSEETYHTFSYSPLSDDDGRIAGMLCVVTEVTERIVGERRLASLSTLGTGLTAARSEAEVIDAIAAGLAAAAKDLPFSLLYLKSGQGELVLARATGIVGGHRAAPPILLPDGPWKISSDVVELGPSFGELPRGPWHQPPKLAVVVPIAPQGQEKPVGVLIVGLNPHRSYDAAYDNFIELASGQIAAALAGARAYEEERRRAQALAEIDRAKTMFFSNVSHEFRTPLTLILGPLDDALVEAASLPDAQRERLLVAHRNALRLLRLVNSLLDFSRIEAGRVKANFQRTDICALTTDLAANFRSATERAGIDLKIDCEDLAGEVFVDRDMWEKIVLNLLSNAFKFTFEGAITVRIRNTRDRSAAELVVSDTGVGIPEKELPHIFERFYRVENQRSRSFEGSGIGLALIHELVKLHSGSIAVESRQGLGTAFTLTVPFGAAHLPSEQIGVGGIDSTMSLRADAIVQEALQWLPGASRPDQSTGPAVALPSDIVRPSAPGRVLVADDNRDMRAYIQNLLGRHWDVVGAADGLAALAEIKRQPPDLVVTDAMMPNLDGFGLLKAIRADPGLRDIPIIMLSARAGEESRIEGLEAGADYYLTKPFSARELIAQVNANLKVAQMRRETTRRLEQSADALSQRTAQYETLLNRAPIGVYVVDEDFRFVEVNPTAMPIFGDMDVIGRDFEEVMHILWVERYAAEIVALFRHTLKTGQPYVTAERSEQRADRGQIEYYEWQIHRITMPDGRCGVVCYFRDISMLVRSRTQRELLINELNHRVKNTLTTIQSMTAQTLAGAGVDRSVNEALEARLISMAGAHDILTQESWSGANLYTIVARALGAFATNDRIRIEGPGIRIVPAAALAVSMALHELATNAVKYGALSGSGKIDVTWRVEDDDGQPWLRLEWVERDGPPVVQPRRQGFGSRLIGRGLASQLGGKAEIKYAPAGVVCHIRAPLAKLMSPAASELVPS